MKYILEICSGSVQSAVNAQQGGATRVELCSGLWESGLTPSYGTIDMARKLLDIEIFILIRPRGGDFVYSDLEFEIMKTDIIACKKLGADGIVSGVLNADNTIDIQRTKELIELSRPLPFTFHRAFDITPSLSASLDQLIKINADRVLTSGGVACVTSAPELIKSLVEQADGNIIILPGGGIKMENVSNLFSSNCYEFHTTAAAMKRSRSKESQLKLNSTSEIPECNYKETTVDIVRSIDEQLKKHFSKSE